MQWQRLWVDNDSSIALLIRAGLELRWQEISLLLAYAEVLQGKTREATLESSLPLKGCLGFILQHEMLPLSHLTGTIPA